MTLMFDFIAITIEISGVPMSAKLKSSIGLQNDISDIILTFTDYLFDKTHYQIFEEPKYSLFKDARVGGYRRRSTRVGDDRFKKVNFSFQLTAPSRVEVEEYIKTWVKKFDKHELPIKSEEWQELIFRYLDDFVINYLIVEPFDTDRVVDIHMGYRRAKDRKGKRILFFAHLLNPSEDELKNVVINWSNEFFS
jgi:hypothetical protein